MSQMWAPLTFVVERSFQEQGKLVQAIFVSPSLSAASSLNIKAATWEHDSPSPALHLQCAFVKDPFFSAASHENKCKQHTQVSRKKSFYLEKSHYITYHSLYPLDFSLNPSKKL